MASIPFSNHALSLECVILAQKENNLQILVHENEHKAYKSKLSLPSGSIKESDAFEKSVKKTLSEFPNLKINAIITGGFSAETERFPKGRVIGLSVIVIADPKSIEAVMPKTSRWVNAAKPGNLALDHKEVLTEALVLVHQKSVFEPIIFDFLPEKFTLTELQAVYENIHGKELDKRNFRKKVLGLKVLSPSKEYQREVSHKAARYFTADRKKFRAYIDGGGLFVF